MIRQCRKCAHFFVAAGLACALCVEVARTVTEPSEASAVKHFVAGPPHAPDLPHSPDNEPSAPPPSSALKGGAAWTASTFVQPFGWRPVPVSASTSTLLWWKPPDLPLV
jgi:hypothetical protein